MLHLDTRVAAALYALLQELQREASHISRELLADVFDEERVVGGDAQAGRLQELVFNLQVERLREHAQQVVGGRSQTGVAAAEVKQGLQNIEINNLDMCK